MMSNLAYRLLSILSLLLLVGCSGDINESKIIASFRSSDRMFTRFHDRFPNAKTTVTEIHVPMSWPSRYCYVGSQAELASGHRLWIQQQVQITRSGDDLEESSFDPAFRIVSGDEKRAELNEAQFERIMDGDDVEAVLLDAGIDFDLGDIAPVDLVKRVRRTVPLIKQAAGDISDTQIRISRKAYHLEGEVSLWRLLGDGFILTATGHFRLLPDNETVELVEGVAPRIRLSDSASDPSRFIDLTEEELSAIVESTNHAKAATTLYQKKNR